MLMMVVMTMMTMMMKWDHLVGDQLRQCCLNQGDVTVLHSHHAEGEKATDGGRRKLARLEEKSFRGSNPFNFICQGTHGYQHVRPHARLVLQPLQAGGVTTVGCPEIPSP